MSKSSSSSSATSGGVSFDVLCQGQEKYYSFNLCDLRKMTMANIIQELIRKVAETMADLKLQSDREIQSFCIGKTYVSAKSNTSFHPMNVDTWRKQGISSRWHTTYQKDGYDGLVVLGAVTRAMLVPGCNTQVWNQQQYALAIEIALISHFAFVNPDKRLCNTSLDPGLLQSSPSAGYVIYLAYKY